MNAKDTRATLTSPAPGAGGPSARDFELRWLRQLWALSGQLKSGKDVAKVTPKANGTFKVSAPLPADGSGAVYRLRTKVRVSAKSSRVAETFTLPRAVEATVRDAAT